MTETVTPDIQARYRQMGIVDRIRTHPAGPVAVVFVVMLTLCSLYALANPTSFYFLTKGNASLVLRAIPNFGIVALGVGLLMISGEFDL